MKKFSLIIFFIFSFTILNSTVTFAEPAVQPVVEQSQQVSPPEQQELDKIPDSIPEKNYENLKKIKDSASTSKVFYTTAVSISLLILFLIYLSIRKLYKDWKDRGYIVSAPPKETLESPKDFKTAINLFLGKTDE